MIKLQSHVTMESQNDEGKFPPTTKNSLTSLLQEGQLNGFAFPDLVNKKQIEHLNIYHRNGKAVSTKIYKIIPQCFLSKYVKVTKQDRPGKN